MKLFIHLIKDIKFWMLLFPFIVVFLSLAAISLFPARLFETSENLPSLPNGETAREFTDVLAVNRINVVTDQGHYYRCNYRAPETCWISIPREVNHPKSTNPGITIPWPPEGTRQMVSTFLPGYAADGDLVLLAIIRSDGQVAFSEELISDYAWGNGSTCKSYCGVLFIVIVVLMAALVRKTREKLRVLQEI
jgi:hypothetical protein